MFTGTIFFKVPMACYGFLDNKLNNWAWKVALGGKQVRQNQPSNLGGPWIVQHDATCFVDLNTLEVNILLLFNMLILNMSSVTS